MTSWPSSQRRSQEGLIYQLGSQGDDKKGSVHCWKQLLKSCSISPLRGRLPAHPSPAAHSVYHYVQLCTNLYLKNWFLVAKAFIYLRSIWNTEVLPTTLKHFYFKNNRNLSVRQEHWCELTFSIPHFEAWKCFTFFHPPHLYSPEVQIEITSESSRSLGLIFPQYQVSHQSYMKANC